MSPAVLSQPNKRKESLSPSSTSPALPHLYSAPAFVPKAASPPPADTSPSKGPLDYNGGELAQGEEIWGLSRLATPPPQAASSPSEPAATDDSHQRVTPQDEDQLVDQTSVTAKTSAGEEAKETLTRPLSRPEAEEDRAQQEVVPPPSAPSSPTQPSPAAQAEHYDDEEEECEFTYPSSETGAPEKEAEPSPSDDPLLSPPPSAPVQAPQTSASTSDPPSSGTPPPSPRPKSPPPDPNLIPSIVAAISEGELYKLERIYAASSVSPVCPLHRVTAHLTQSAFAIFPSLMQLSPFALSNTPLSHHTLVTPLHLAASHGHLPIVQFLCSSEGGALVGMEDAEGETALHKASLKGHLPVVAFLIKYQNVNPHARDKEGFTALHNACSKGFLDIVRFLVSSKLIGHRILPSLNGLYRSSLSTAVFELVSGVVRSGGVNLGRARSRQGRRPEEQRNRMDATQ